MGCAQDVVGEKIFLVQFEDGQKREVGYCFLVYVCSEEEFYQEVNEPIYDPLQYTRWLLHW